MKQLPLLNHVAGDRTRAEASATTEVGRTRPAIIVPVQAIEPVELELRCQAIAATGIAEVIEWRIDPLLAHVGAAASGRKETSGREEAAAAGAADLAEAVLSSAPSVTAAGLPVLVTLRSGFEGGAGPIGEDVYAEVLRTLLTKLPAAVAVDVEIDRLGASEIIDVAHENGVLVVASHHNFTGTDPVETLVAKFAEMAAAGADVAKIAMMPTSLAEVADVLRATAQADAALECPMLGISMGELGRTSRIMGGDFGSCATFAQLGEASAPGQIDVAELSAVFDRLYG